MDFILFFIGLCALVFNYRALTLAIIVILTSTYLQLPVTATFWMSFLFSHNVSDIGLVLYILLFAKETLSGNFSINTPLTKPTVILLSFLVLNGVYDVFRGTNILDVVNFLKLKFLITIVFISGVFSGKCVVKAYRYILYATIFFCIIQLLDSAFGLGLIETRSVEERGAKPVYTVMLFGLLPFVDLFRQSMSKRVLYTVIILLPIILNMKMTYAGTVFLSALIYIFISGKVSRTHKIGYIVLTALAVICIFAFSSKFTARFTEMTNESIDVNSTESSGNFSYRILHAYERLYYISGNVEYAVRGIGYIAEKNFKKQVFIFGQYSEQSNGIAQLDTGDIAWSIFFIRYGFVGIIIYLFYYFSLIKQFRNWTTSLTWRNYWLSILWPFLIFTSFGNTIVEQYYFFVFPILFIMTHKNENRPHNLLLQHRRLGNNAH